MSQQELGNPNSRTWKRLAEGQGEIATAERQRADDLEARLVQAERALEKADAVIAHVERLGLKHRAIAAYRTERKEGDCEHGYKAAGGTATCPVCEEGK